MEGRRREYAELASHSPPPAPAPPAWGSASEILGYVWIFNFLGHLKPSPSHGTLFESKILRV